MTVYLKYLKVDVNCLHGFRAIYSNSQQSFCKNFMFKVSARFLNYFNLLQGAPYFNVTTYRESCIPTLLCLVSYTSFKR